MSAIAGVDPGLSEGGWGGGGGGTVGHGKGEGVRRSMEVFAMV